MDATEVVKHVLLRSGASWVLWFLAGLSVLCVALGLERWLFYRALGGNLRWLADRLDACLGRGDFAGAVAEMGRSKAVAAAIAAAGLRLADRGPAAAGEAMQSAAALERTRLERWLAVLGTVGNNAPFIGLFGTVIGVIHAFEQLGAKAPTATAAANQIASQGVMVAVAEALVATAVGIAVALPAVAAYNYFQRRVAELMASTETLSHLVLAYLQPAPGAPPPAADRPTPGPTDAAAGAAGPARLAPEAG